MSTFAQLALFAAQDLEGIVLQGLVDFGLALKRSVAFRRVPRLSETFRNFPFRSVSFRPDASGFRSCPGRSGRLRRRDPALRCCFKSMLCPFCSLCSRSSRRKTGNALVAKDLRMSGRLRNVPVLSETFRNFPFRSETFRNFPFRSALFRAVPGCYVGVRALPAAWAINASGSR